MNASTEIPPAGEGRVVIHLGDSAEISALNEKTSSAEVRHAVGYLSLWNTSYPECRLMYNAKDGEIAATYWRDGVRGYVICAVWSQSNRAFYFHS